MVEIIGTVCAVEVRQRQFTVSRDAADAIAVLDLVRAVSNVSDGTKTSRDITPQTGFVWQTVRAIRANRQTRA